MTPHTPPLRALQAQGEKPAKSLAGRVFPQESSDGKGTAQLPHPAVAGSKRPLRGAKRSILPRLPSAFRDGGRSDIR